MSLNEILIMTTPSYSAVSAIGVPFGINQRWVTVDISTASVSTLFSTYRVLQLTLNVLGSTTPVYLQLSTLAPTYSNYVGTVGGMLTLIGNATLPTTTTPLLLNVRSATYMDAFRAGYTATPVSNTNALVPYVAPTSLPDLRLTRTDIALDYNHFVANALVSVNGYYHYISTDGVNGIQVKDAVSSLNVSSQNEVGIWNFTNVGNISTIPITSGMINTALSNRPVITLPMDTTGKYVFLMLGGYPVYVDGQALTQLSSTQFSINFTLVSILERFFESGNYIDLSSVVTASGLSGYVGATVAALTTTPSILAWLALSQSFFVVLNNPNVFIQKQYVKRIGMPNQYISYQDPIYPLVMALGRHPSYWKIGEVGEWRISIYNNTVGNIFYNASSVDLPGNFVNGGSNQPGMPGMLQEAYLLQLGSDVS